MTKLLIWLLILGGIYSYFRMKADKAAHRRRHLRDQLFEEDAIDVEAEVIESSNKHE